MKIFKATALIILILLTTKIFHHATYMYDQFGYGHACVYFLGFVALLGLFFFLLGRLSKKTLIIETEIHIPATDDEAQERADRFAKHNVSNFDDSSLESILSTAYITGYTDYRDELENY